MDERKGEGKEGGIRERSAEGRENIPSEPLRSSNCRGPGVEEITRVPSLYVILPEPPATRTGKEYGLPRMSYRILPRSAVGLRGR